VVVAPWAAVKPPAAPALQAPDDGDPNDPSILMPDRQLLARRLIERIYALGGEIRLRGDDVRIELHPVVPVELRAEVTELKPDLVQLLRTEGTEIIDDEEASHADLNTPQAPELTARQKLDASIQAAPRRYAGGEILVNDREGMRYGQAVSGGSASKLNLVGLINPSRVVIRAENLLDMNQVEYEMVLQCSINGRSQYPVVPGTPWRQGGVGNVRFAGVPLAAVLQKYNVRVDPQVRYVTAEGTTCRGDLRSQTSSTVCRWQASWRKVFLL